MGFEQDLTEKHSLEATAKDLGIPGHGDDRQMPVPHPELFGEPYSVFVGHREIGDDDVGPECARTTARLHEPSGTSSLERRNARGRAARPLGCLHGLRRRARGSRSGSGGWAGPFRGAAPGKTYRHGLGISDAGASTLSLDPI